MNLRNKSKSTINVFREVQEKPTMVSFKNSDELLTVFRKHARTLVGLCLPTVTDISSRVNLFCRFPLYLIQMHRRHGDVFVVKYLKASLIAIQKKIAGEPFKSLRDIEPGLPLPRLSSSGLPVIIPLRDRRSICNKSVHITRLYLSLFSLYRIISIPGIVKISTITQANKVISNVLGRVAL
jgi:hypothetical protein